MPAIINGSELILTGTVGDLDWGWSDCFTPAEVILALAQIGPKNDVTIRLNSGGGIATDGAAIHAAIARHQGRKIVVVEGIAASAASVIAMAGDDVVMSLGAILMIHDPSAWTVGTIKDHEAQIAGLTALADSMASIYAAKSGLSQAECRADMEAEVWLTAEDSVAKGYADRIAGAEAEELEPVAFDYRKYAHAPQRFLMMADKRAAELRGKKEPAVMTEKKDDQNKSTDPAQAGSGQQDAAYMSRSDAAEIARLCVDGGVPHMTAGLIAEGATIATAKTRINMAGQVKDMVALARRTCPSIPEDIGATMMAEGKTAEEVRAALFDKMVAAGDSTQIVTHHRAGAGGSDHSGDQKTAVRERGKAAMRAELAKQGIKV